MTGVGLLKERSDDGTGANRFKMLHMPAPACGLEPAYNSDGKFVRFADNFLCGGDRAKHRQRVTRFGHIVHAHD